MKIFRRNLPLSQRAQWVKDFDGEPAISHAGVDVVCVAVGMVSRKQELDLFFTRSEVARMLATFS